MDGKTIMPGFIDAHVHLFLGGLALDMLDLRPVGALKPHPLF